MWHMWHGLRQVLSGRSLSLPTERLAAHSPDLVVAELLGYTVRVLGELGCLSPEMSWETAYSQLDLWANYPHILNLFGQVCKAAKAFSIVWTVLEAVASKISMAQLQASEEGAPVTSDALQSPESPESPESLESLESLAILTFWLVQRCWKAKCNGYFYQCWQKRTTALQTRGCFGRFATAFGACEDRATAGKQPYGACAACFKVSWSITRGMLQC